MNIYQHIIILYAYLSENFVRYNCIHLNATSVGANKLMSQKHSSRDYSDVCQLQFIFRNNFWLIIHHNWSEVENICHTTW